MRRFSADLAQVTHLGRGAYRLLNLLTHRSTRFIVEMRFFRRLRASWQRHIRRLPLPSPPNGAARHYHEHCHHYCSQWCDLPDPAATLIAQYLDTQSLTNASICLRVVVIFRELLAQRQTMFLPADDNRLNSILARARADDSPLPSHFTLGDDVETLLRLPHRERVTGVRITPWSFGATTTGSWFRHSTMRITVPQSCFRSLSAFSHLVSLEIHTDWFSNTVDLQLLSYEMPQLQKLSIAHARGIVNHLRLPHLHTLALESTNINSFAIATDLPRLSSFSLLMKASHVPLVEAYCLLLLPPLRELVVRGWWQEDSTPLLRHHLPTLRVCQLGFYGHFKSSSTPSANRHSVLAFRSSLASLTSLSLGDDQQDDLAPFAALQSLELLQLFVAASVTDCRPLRQLTKLRSLEITRGWLRDILGYLPRLESLVSHDDWWDTLLEPTPHERTKLTEDDDMRSTATVAHGSRNLRQLILTGDYRPKMTPNVMVMLDHVEHVELRLKSNSVDVINNFDEAIQLVMRLPNIKCLHLTWGGNNKSSRWMEREFTVAPASLQTLEEIRLKSYNDKSLCLPAWLQHASALRKLVLQLHVQVGVDRLPRGLTHLYMPCYDQRKLCRSQMLRLSNLRIVSIPVTASCAALRRARKRGGALPHLQCIFHPHIDCLSLPSAACCKRLRHRREPALALLPAFNPIVYRVDPLNRLGRCRLYGGPQVHYSPAWY